MSIYANNRWKSLCFSILMVVLSFSFSYSQPNPVLSFKASQNDQQVYFTWQSSTITGSDHFLLEHSDNGDAFEVIAVIRSGAKNISTYSYDHTAAKGLHYFRLKLTDAAGKWIYSEILQISIGPKKSITVFPNPSNGKFTLAHPMASGKEQVQVLDRNGLTIYQASLTKSSIQTVFDLTSFQKGSYQIIWLGEFEKLSLKIFIQ